MSEIIHEVNEHIRLIQNTDGLTFGTDAYPLSAFVQYLKIDPRQRLKKSLIFTIIWRFNRFVTTVF